jgi:hypothetical protein
MYISPPLVLISVTGSRAAGPPAGGLSTLENVADIFDGYRLAEARERDG